MLRSKRTLPNSEDSTTNQMSRWEIERSRQWQSNGIQDQNVRGTTSPTDRQTSDERPVSRRLFDPNEQSLRKITFTTEAKILSKKNCTKQNEGGSTVFNWGMDPWTWVLAPSLSSRILLCFDCRRWKTRFSKIENKILKQHPKINSMSYNQTCAIYRTLTNLIETY